jgi:hypothetical protein
MSRKKLLAVAIATALSTGMVGIGTTSVYAADDSAQGATPAQHAVSVPDAASAKEQTANKATDKEFIKVSEDAQMTMRNVHAARLAIYNGMTDQAQTYVDAAVARVEATMKDANKYAVNTKAPHDNDVYVPFDSSLAVADDFVPNPAKMKHIAKANEHLRKGEKKEALEVLKLGDVDVSIGTELVPVKLAKQHIDEAAKLVDEGKYYDANLVLKSVEDAVVVETVALDAAPNKAKG